MVSLPRWSARRAGTQLARPNPKTAVVEVGTDAGTLGGPTTGGYVRRYSGAAPTASMLSASKVTADVARAMRLHPQISACLVVQSLPMLRAEAVIDCDDDDIRESVTSWWEKIRPEVMRSATRALWAGYSPNVLVWGVDDSDGPQRGGLYVQKIRDLDPYTCKALSADNGDYAGFVQNEGSADEARFDGVDEQGRDRRLLTLWMVEGMESGNLYGRSILGPVLQDWQEQQALSLFHLRGLERFGNPVVKTTAPSGQYIVNQADIDAAAINGVPAPDPIYRDRLADALQMGTDLANGSVLAIPSERITDAEGKDRGPAWDVSYLESTKSAADVADAIDAKDRRIRLGMIVPSLLLEGGDTVGSNALGQSHRDTFTNNAEARLDDYAGQITRHLIDRYVTLNYAPGSPRATLSFAPLSDDAKDELWGVATHLVETGQLAVDVAEVAARTGIPLAEDQPDPAETPASDPTAVPVQEGAFSQVRDGERLARPADVVTDADWDEAAMLARAADVSGLVDWKYPQQYDTPTGFRRPLTTRENGTSLRRLEDGMNTAEAATLDRLETLLDGSREKVLRQVAAIIRRGGAEADILTALGTLDIGPSGPYAAAWTELQRTLWSLGLDSVRAELAAFAEKVPGAIGAEGRALVAAYATASANRVTAELATRVQVEVLNTYRSGVGRAGLEAAVSDLFERESRREAQATRLTTRMLSAQAVNAGRADAIQRGGVPLRGAQYSALLDHRTCQLCERLDEKVIGIGDLDFQKFTAPIHHGCRCCWIFITADEVDFTPTWESPPRSLVESFGSLVVR